METTWSYTGERAYFSSDERKWHTRIHRLAAEYPDKVIILKEPQENDGCIYAALPSEFVKIGAPRRMTFTDEQRAALAERARNLRKKERDDAVNE